MEKGSTIPSDAVTYPTQRIHYAELPHNETSLTEESNESTAFMIQLRQHTNSFDANFQRFIGLKTNSSFKRRGFKERILIES